MVLPVVLAKISLCRNILFIDILSLKQQRIRAHEWDAPTVESAQPITRITRDSSHISKLEKRVVNKIRAAEKPHVKLRPRTVQNSSNLCTYLLFIHLFTHSFTHSFIHSLTHSFIHSFIHSFTYLTVLLAAKLYTVH